MAAAARGVTGSALLVALLACAAARVAIVVGGASPCDGKDCGMGTCEEVPLITLPPITLPIPTPALPNVSKCDCDPGWSQFAPGLDFLPCTIPKCSSGDSCLNITLAPPTTSPENACFIDICGPDGKCVLGKSPFDFQCQCNPGAVNLFNLTALPCIRNCVIGKDGCPVPPPPSPPPPSSPAPPPGNPDSSGPTAPSSTKGNATSLGSVSSLQNLLLFLLASLAAVQIV